MRISDWSSDVCSSDLNAGIMRFESLDRRSDLTDAEATITTNLLGPIRLTNALIDHLSARPDAAIVNVTSGLAFVPPLTTPKIGRPHVSTPVHNAQLRCSLLIEKKTQSITDITNHYNIYNASTKNHIPLYIHKQTIT